MNMMEQVHDVPTQEVITKDNATVSVDGVVFYQVFDAAKARYEVSRLDISILALTTTNIRTVMGSMDLDQLLSHRDEINERLLRVVDAAVSAWGVKINRIEIKDIVPPADLVAAMARQMKAERDKRAAVLEAEGLRQAQILKAEGQKQSQILQAEGRREAAFRDAEARERLGEADAKATAVLSGAVAGGDPAALNYYIAKNMSAPSSGWRLRRTKGGPDPLRSNGASVLARRHRGIGPRGFRRDFGPRATGATGRPCRGLRPQTDRRDGRIPWTSPLFSPAPGVGSRLAVCSWVLEVAAPGASLIWLGIAAAVTGLLSFAFALGWEIQVACSRSCLVASVIVGRRLAPSRDKASDRPFLQPAGRCAGGSGAGAGARHRGWIRHGAGG